MILGVLLARKSYPWMKYLCVLLIVTGVATFVYKDKGSSKTSDHIIGIGEILVVSLNRISGKMYERTFSPLIILALKVVLHHYSLQTTDSACIVECMPQIITEMFIMLIGSCVSNYMSSTFMYV